MALPCSSRRRLLDRRLAPAALLCAGLLAACSFLEEGLVPSLTGEAPPEGAAPPTRASLPEAPPADPAAPLLLLRFGSPPPDWRGTLVATSREALERRPLARFEIRALAPESAGAAGLAEAGRHGEAVYHALLEAGVPALRLALSAAGAAGLALPEVRLYLR